MSRNFKTNANTRILSKIIHWLLPRTLIPKKSAWKHQIIQFPGWSAAPSFINIISMHDEVQYMHIVLVSHKYQWLRRRQSSSWWSSNIEFITGTASQATHKMDDKFKHWRPIKYFHASIQKSYCRNPKWTSI